MLLQSIKLVNFRQFLNEEIAFASGKDGKNVTIILGENGTGKTTFAQAFFWCLYGETEFSDKMILNRLVANKLLSGQSAKVSVELVLQHGENTYTITREQTYTKDGSGNIKGANTVFDILRRDKTGNTTAIKPTLRETEINSILPKELSKYFFFDGERIERMSKDISTHKKATDFADAVRSLLGLKGMEKAIQHLNPGSKTSVIGQYEASYDASSNTRIAELTRTIEECNEKIEKLNARINELDRQIELAQTRKAQKTEELKQYEDGEKWQSQKEKLEKRIAAAKQARSNMVKAICLDFSGNIGSFLSLWMTQKAMRMLQDRDFTGKDIPHMHGDTIEYLLHQKVCICGTHLTEGSVPYEKVKSLIDFLPPKSLSANISDFKKAAVRRVSGAQQTNLLDQVTEHLGVISQQEDEIINLSEDLHAVEQNSAVTMCGRKSEQLMRRSSNATKQSAVARKSVTSVLVTVAMRRAVKNGQILVAESSPFSMRATKRPRSTKLMLRGFIGNLLSSIIRVKMRFGRGCKTPLMKSLSRFTKVVLP